MTYSLIEDARHGMDRDSQLTDIDICRDLLAFLACFFFTSGLKQFFLIEEIFKKGA